MNHLRASIWVLYSTRISHVAFGWRRSCEEGLMARRSKSSGWSLVVDTTSPLCTLLKLNGIGRCACKWRVALSAGIRCGVRVQEIRRARSLHGGETHLLQVVARGGALKIGLRRSSRRERHARPRYGAHMMSGVRGLLKVGVGSGALHGGGRHRDARHIMTDGTECLFSCDLVREANIRIAGVLLTSRGRRTENK